MDQIYRIRLLHKLRGIAREAGNHFGTLKKYVEKKDFNLQLRKKQPRYGKLSPFKYLISGSRQISRPNPNNDIPFSVCTIALRNSLALISMYLIVQFANI